MRATATRLMLAACAVIAVGCSGPRTTTSETPKTVTPGEGSGTTGSRDEQIKVSGCVTHVDPDGYLLTSLDDAIEQHMGTAGHHTDDPKSAPTQANSGGDNARARSDENVSAGFGRYRLAGDAARFATFLDKEVNISGRVQHTDREHENSTPLTLSVESIQTTGAACGANQNQGNDRGVLPGQDLPKKLR